MQRNILSCIFAIFVTGLFAPGPQAAAGKEFIVKDGKANAEIVTPDKPCSSVKLAATELQAYIKKISGATLPIKPPLVKGAAKDKTAPAPAQAEQPEMPVKIYVGKSAYTDKLGITDKGLKYGAYRMQSGKDWLALIGNDTVFKPRGIYSTRSKKDVSTEWDKVTGSFWGNPIGRRMYKKYNKQLDLWRHDEKGTLNAVYGFLRGLGVRWYMEGELGEIVPELKTIALPEVNKVVKPDYDIRMVAYARYGGSRQDEVLWSLRMGVNDPYGFHSHHGIANVTARQEMKEKHPDYFAVYNGERDTGKSANACLSSEGLFQENLRFVRFMFDMYDVPIVSVWPADGFSSICQCEKCKGKDTPARGRQGLMSDYVWDYVNRIAIEVDKTHPGKLISCGAYSTYLLPPEKIDVLHSNVVVYIVNGRRRFPQEDLNRKRLDEWARKTGGKVIDFMNFGGSANTPGIIASDIKDLKDISIGEDMWPPFYRGGIANPGFNHLNYYLSARLEWDADQDIDQLLDEYYRLFYGPVAKEMKAFVDFYEQKQYEMRKIDSAPVIKQALDLFEVAKKKADPESVYGKRIALFEKGLAGLKKRYELVKAGRVNVPTYTLTGKPEDMADIKIDGKLDEKFWKELPGSLKILQDGGDPKYPTRFRVGVSGNNLYVGIQCTDVKGQPFNAMELVKDDYGIWEGDVIEILLETPGHSYYQIAVNPKGAVADLDRDAAKSKWITWDAQAEVAVQEDEAAGTWSVEARIPFTPSSQDPLHEIIGPPPSKDHPWHFNICRQRIRNQGAEKEMSAFSPTGEKNRFHNILKLGKLD
ncbi:DUF4838 domain-containing protein [Verrucomicrobiota bacterium]